MADVVKNIFTYSTINSGGTSVTVSNIPQDAKHMICNLSPQTTGSNPTVAFNGVSTNYIFRFVNAETPSDVTSTNAPSLSPIVWAWSDPVYAGATVRIPFYSVAGPKVGLFNSGMFYYWSFNQTIYRYPYWGTFSNSSNTSAITSLTFASLPANTSISIDLVYT